jgi:hypothetical protein
MILQRATTFDSLRNWASFAPLITNVNVMHAAGPITPFCYC